MRGHSPVLVACLSLGLLLNACDATEPGEGTADTQSVGDWQRWRAPHGAEIMGTIPGFRMSCSGEWTGRKMILRAGTRLNFYVWGTPEITVELYQWWGSGWHDPLLSRNGTQTGPIPADGIDDLFLQGAFRAIDADTWQAAEDGLYLVVFHGAYEALLDVAGGEYYDAASCAEDHGLCKQLDAEASCVYRCDQQGADGSCTKGETPAYCEYDPQPDSGDLVLE